MYLCILSSVDSSLLRMRTILHPSRIICNNGRSGLVTLDGFLDSGLTKFSLTFAVKYYLAEYQARFTHKCFRAPSELTISLRRKPPYRQRSSRLILICLPSKGRVSLRPRRRSLEKESARYLIPARKPRNTIPPKMRVGRRRYAN